MKCFGFLNIQSECIKNFLAIHAFLVFYANLAAKTEKKTVEKDSRWYCPIIHLESLMTDKDFVIDKVFDRRKQMKQRS